MLYKFTRNDIELRFALIKDNIIQNHLDWADWQKISNEDILMKVEPLDLAEKTATGMVTAKVPAGAIRAMVTETVMSRAATPALRATRALPARAALAMDDYKEFRKLWRKNKSIPGFVMLHPNGRLVWISNIDLKYFEEVE